MVFNATFNNISAISWRSVLLVEETRVPRETTRPVASHWQTLSHNVISSTPRHEKESLDNLVVFYYFILFKVRPDKKEGPYKGGGGTTV